MLVVTVNGSRKILQKFITQKFNDCERAMHFYYGNNINNLICQNTYAEDCKEC